MNYKCTHRYPGGPDVGYILNPQKTNFNGMWYWHNNLWFNPEDFPEYWEPVREPIFTTEDGVDMYDGTTYWYVQFSGYLGSAYQQLYTVYKFTARESQESIINAKTFSTKEKAEAWIEENKPQFSKKDLLSCGRFFFTKGAFRTTELTIEELFDEYTELKKLKK